MKRLLLAGGIVLVAIVLGLMMERPEEWSPERVSSVQVLEFALPNMDKQMCETFPRTVVDYLEEMPGVLDVEFLYDGHRFRVYFDPNEISRDDLLNDEMYAWVGVTFIGLRKSDRNPQELYSQRKSNNPTEMPEGHMADVEDGKLMDAQKLPPIVDAEWLELNRDNVKVIEIGPRSQYEKGHFPGALNIEVGQIRKTVDGVAEQTIPGEEFAALLQSLGITPTDRIVVYASESLTHQSRLYLALKQYGHRQVAMLDGGKAALGGKLDTGEPQIVPGVHGFREMGLIVGADYVLSRLGNDSVVLLDVRTPQEFAQGRIPGAINLDWRSFVNPDGTLKPVDELRKLTEGIDPSKEVIVYCVSGTRASYAWFVLSEVLGYNAKVFDGSMIEWNYRQLPVEK